jgi:uncharacterized protein (TIGR00730 family)
MQDRTRETGKKRIVVFSGSACTDPGWMELAVKLGQSLGQSGYMTINGGGPGLMHLVLKGAKDAGGSTFAVQLGKHEREQSPFADETISFENLKPRQDELLKWGDAFVALPGGIGTFYEVLEILALKNTGFLRSKPLILLTHHYTPFLEWMQSGQLAGMVPDEWGEYFDFAPELSDCIRILKAKLS